MILLYYARTCRYNADIDFCISCRKSKVCDSNTHDQETLSQNLDQAFLSKYLLLRQLLLREQNIVLNRF